MSDHWIIAIPQDPNLIPDAPRRVQAEKWFSGIAPDADKIETKFSEEIRFYNCGGNFERILCPACRAEIPVTWWQDRMNEDYKSTGFKLSQHASPCCGNTQTLHELVYEWPQGFGRFALVAMNANIGELNDGQCQELEQILGTPLRIIYQHI